jgi:subtilisin family serine protease
MLESRIKKLYEMNIPVVCAAGNTGQGGVNWPAAYDETIAVAAHDKNGRVASFSSRGDRVEWAAPGVNIYSTYLNNGYASLNGTSMACPFVAGVIALMLAKHKRQEKETGKNDCKTVEQIREHLLKYTMDKGKIGKDNAWGYGVIDVEKLIGTKPEPKPTPEPDIPHPYPEPEKPEAPEEDAENWRRILIKVGAVIAIGLASLTLSECNKKKSEVNWDEKFEKEMEGIND